MSTVKATNLQHASATSPNITLGSDGSVAVGGGNISPQTGFRNRIINGDMRIDQRNDGASVTSGFIVDRFQMYSTQSGKWTAQRSTVAPEGFTNSVLITSSSAYTPISTDYFSYAHRIEGFNVADLGWGTANAQPITVSFRVRSSLTGTFTGALHNSAFNRVYAFSYTIDAANTWETKTVTIVGDTTGTWLTDNSVGIEIGFAISAGSTRLAAAGSWSGTSGIFGATGQTNLLGTNGATFYITGVQLEKGSVATPFEFRSIGQELALCQRYYQQLGGTGVYEYIGDAVGVNATLAYAGISLITTMRSAPSFSFTVGANNFTLDYGSNNTQATNLTLNVAAVNKVRLNVTTGGGLGGGAYYTFLTYGASTGKLQFSAEL